MTCLYVIADRLGVGCDTRATTDRLPGAVLVIRRTGDLQWSSTAIGSIIAGVAWNLCPFGQTRAAVTMIEVRDFRMSACTMKNEGTIKKPFGSDVAQKSCPVARI